MTERSIDELLGVLPDEIEPDPDFAAGLRRRLQFELEASPAVRGDAVGSRSQPPTPEVLVLQREGTPNGSPHRWQIAAIAAGLLLAIGGVVLMLNRDDEPRPADEPAVTLPATVPTTEVLDEVEQSAVDAATGYFEAFGRGDGDAVFAMSHPSTLDADREAALVAWWSLAAGSGDASATWPSGACVAVATDDGGVVTVECPLDVADPVAGALDIEQVLWTVDVSADGEIRRRAEPLTASLGTYAPVWAAHADYLAAYRADDYAASCDPATYQTGKVWPVGRLALSEACGELVQAAAPDAAAWIADGRPEPPATTEP